MSLPNEKARWWQIRDLAAKGHVEAGPAGVADALEPVLEGWFAEVRREAGLAAVREHIENGPIYDDEPTDPTAATSSGEENDDA